VRFKARLLQKPKRSYGLNATDDIDDQNKNAEETATPMNHHETPPNAVNTAYDTAADEFPGLGKHKHRFPARGIN